MPTRTATCSCAAVTATCEGEPARVTVCHCLACQRRTGSAFGAQALFPDAAVTVTGQTAAYVRTADSGTTVTYRFCPSCGATIAYQAEVAPGLTIIPLGALADPTFPHPPARSGHEASKHPWVDITGEVLHVD